MNIGYLDLLPEEQTFFLSLYLEYEDIEEFEITHGIYSYDGESVRLEPLTEH